MTPEQQQAVLKAARKAFRNLGPAVKKARVSLDALSDLMEVVHPSKKGKT